MMKDIPFLSHVPIMILCRSALRIAHSGLNRLLSCMNSKVPPSIGLDPEFWSNDSERQLRTSSYHASYGPPAQGTASGNMAHDDLQPPVIGPAEQHALQGNEGVGHHGPPPGVVKHVSNLPIAPGPPRLGYCTLPPHLQEMPYNGATGAAPQPPNDAGTSQGILAQVPSGMSAMEDLKQLASRYLNNPDSHVDEVHVARCRPSGRVKVTILLDMAEVEECGCHKWQAGWMEVAIQNALDEKKAVLLERVNLNFTQALKVDLPPLLSPEQILSLARDPFLRRPALLLHCFRQRLRCNLHSHVRYSSMNGNAGASSRGAYVHRKPCSDSDAKPHTPSVSKSDTIATERELWVRRVTAGGVLAWKCLESSPAAT
ncbi:hypothetical protein BJV78DRAFT_1355724 [Lactifluus subvellereus]|nr:hypothetical protein BJV78DRAFT_1355724 [Lactifluus subvellereus]